MPTETLHSKKWTREQTKLAFHLYCQTPFGKLHHSNSDIVALASLIGRTPSALAMKCVNLASLDPAIVSSGRRGLSNASKLDREIWDEFHANWEHLAVECDQLRRELFRRNETTESRAVDKVTEIVLDINDYVGETRTALVQQRVKQAFFRRMVLSGYRERCCISGVTEPRLLVASHIVAWRDDKANRLNPSNGLCLSAIHDKAFDAHLFTLTDDWRVLLSAKIKASRDKFLREVFWSVDDKTIELPERFVPDPDLVRRHRHLTLAPQATD